MPALSPIRIDALALARERRLPLTASLTHLVDVAIDGSYRYPRHRHDHYEAIVVNVGVYRCELNGETIALDPGRALLVKPGDWHEDRLDGLVRYTGIGFRLSGGGRGASVALINRDAPQSAQVARLDAAALAVLERLRAEAGEDTLAAGGIRDALLAEFFWRLARALPREVLAKPFRERSDEDTFVGRLQRLFDERLDVVLPVPAMAAAVGMSPSSFTRCCRATLGVSPARAARNHRLDQARLLIEMTGMTVKEAAERLGFADQFHFSRAFKRRHGRPPSAVR